MEEYWPTKSNISFNDEEGVRIILSYNSSDKPSSRFIYFGNDKYNEMMMDFHAHNFGKENIEKYWEDLINLDKNKELTLNTLCNTIEKYLVPSKLFNEKLF